MKISDLSVSEVERCRALCNFTEDERKCFELRLKKYTNIKIAMEMYVSESQVSKLVQKINAKISRVL